MSKREYEVVPGFFIQDDPKQEHIQKARTPILPRFGLIDESPERWTTFVTKIKALNENAAPGVQYKVFFLGRHGEGYHNVAEDKYGFDEFKRYWAMQNGDGDIVWGPDPRLTELGEQQARDAHLAWKEERHFGIPVPGKFYASPLTRAIRTNQLTFDDSTFPGIKVTIIENIREYYGVHTPDKRRTRSEIHDEFPEYLFEDGFTEEDVLWMFDYREVHEDIVERCRRALDAIFDNDEEQVVSITSHGGFLINLLRFVKHRGWSLPTGGVIPVVIKGSITKEELRNQET